MLCTVFLFEKKETIKIDCISASTLTLIFLKLTHTVKELSCQAIKHPNESFTDTEANCILFANIVLGFMAFLVPFMSSAAVDSDNLKRLYTNIIIACLGTTAIKFILLRYNDVHKVHQAISMGILLTYTLYNSVLLSVFLF